MKARKPVKPFYGWAHVGPDNKIVTICKAPQVYGTKRDVLLDMDAENGDRAVRVLVSEIKPRRRR